VVAENGAAGLEVFVQLRDEICLVLSDIIMPAVSGIDMAEGILKIEPQTKVLLMSGYSDEAIELQGRNRFPFIRKPFIYTVLIEKIRSMIGRSDANATTSAHSYYSHRRRSPIFARYKGADWRGENLRLEGSGDSSGRRTLAMSAPQCPPVV
jgi:YesN/AraC family two-component response regulator